MVDHLSVVAAAGSADIYRPDCRAAQRKLNLRASLNVFLGLIPPLSHLPEEQGERAGASRPSTSCLGVGGRGLRDGLDWGGGTSRRGGEQELSVDGAGGVARLNGDQRDGALAAQTCGRNSNSDTVSQDTTQAAFYTNYRSQQCLQQVAATAVQSAHQ